MADTVAHIVYLSNQDSGGSPPPGPSTDYLLIEPTPIGFVPPATGNTQYLNRLVVAPNGFLYAIDVVGNAIQFSGTTSNIYQNGLFKTAGVVELGGQLEHATAINLNNFNLNFTGNGNITIGGTNGPERFNIYDGNVYLDEAGAAVRHKSPDGTLWDTTITDEGNLKSESGATVRQHLTTITAGTEATLLAIPEVDRVPRQFYYATDIDMFMYVRDNKAYEYLNNTKEFVQSTPSTIWTINHGLRRHPSVTCVDNSGFVFYGEVKYQDNNTIILLFTTAVSGKAYLN